MNQYYADTFDNLGDKECHVVYQGLKLLKEVSGTEEMPVIDGLLAVLEHDLKARKVL